MGRMLTPHEIASEVAAISGKKVRVEYHDNPRQYAVGLDQYGLVIKVPKKSEFVDAAVFAGILHESLHAKYTTIWSKEEAVKLLTDQGFPEVCCNILFDCINAIEDARIEARAADEYAGAADILDDGHRAISDVIMSEALAGLDEAEKGEAAGTPGAKEQACMMRARLFLVLTYAFLAGREEIYRGQMDWYYDESLLKLSEKLGFWWSNTGAATPKNLPSIAGTLGGGRAVAKLRRELLTLPDTVSCVTFINTYIFDKYVSLLPPDLKEKAQQMQDMMNALKGAIASGQLEVKPAEPGDANGTALEAESGINGNEALDKALDRMLGEQGEGQKDTWGKGWDLDERQKHLLADQSENLQRIEELGRPIKRKLAQILESIKRMHDDTGYVSGLQRGELDAEALPDIVMGRDDIFMRQDTEDLNGEIAFSITVDVSGSMYGCSGNSPDTTLVKALAGAHGIGMALKEIGRPFAVGGFQGSAQTFTKMNEPFSPVQLAEMIAWGLGGTNVLRGFEEAMKELKTAQEQTKVMFLITDGSCSEQHVQMISQQLKDAGDGYLGYFILISGYETDGAMFSKHLDKSRVFTVKDADEIVPIMAKVAKKILMNAV